MNAASLQFFIAPKCWKGDLTLVRPEEVQRWNHIRLSKEDVQTKFVRHLMVLLENNQYAQLDQQSFDLLGLTFCIPTESGEYFDLIPHGRYIAVRQENACEFFIRFKYAVDTAVGRPASYCAAAEDVLGYGSIAMAPHPQPTSAAAVAPAAVSSDTSPEEAAVVNGKKAENEKHQFLVVEDDLVALDQFDAAARAMLSDHAEAQSISVDGLRWAITLRDKVEIPLIQHGARTYVDQTEAEAFYRAIIDKVQEVRKEVLQNGCYRPDNEEDDGAAQVAASPGQASGQANADAEDAVNASSSLYQREMEEVRRSQHMRATARPLSPTEKELALFSPSHLTCGLFSPPQHVSI